MEKKLLNIFKDICEGNDEIIKTKDEVMPMCFLIGRNYKVVAMAFTFADQEEKTILRDKIKGLLLRANIKGYILVMDAKMTMIDKKKKKTIVTDVILRNLYTAKEVRREWVTYKNKKIISKQKFPIDKRKKTKKFPSMQDEWDLWGEGVDGKAMKKEGFDYYKFKMDNKELYDGVVEPFEDYMRIYEKKDKKNIIFAHKFNHEDRNIKYFITDKFRENKEAMEVFKIMKMSGYKLIEIDKKEKEI